MRSNLQIYIPHVHEYRLSVQIDGRTCLRAKIIHSSYKLCTPYFRDDLRRTNSEQRSVWHNGLVMITP